MAELPPIRRRFAAALLLLGIVVCGALASVALAQQSGIPNSPIVITGNQVYTWTQGNERVFLITGNGRITQGSTVISLPRGVVWVNDQTQNLTNAYLLDIYGEDGVSLTQDGQKKDGPRGVASLNTRGEIRITSGAANTPPTRQDQSIDPVFQRAQQERGRIGILRANTSSLTTTATFGDLQPVQGFVPADPQAIPPAPPGPPGQLTAQFAQGGPVPPTMQPLPAPPNSTPPPLPPPFFGPAPPVIVPEKTGAPRNFSVRPRSSTGINVKNYVTPNGETVYVVTEGVIVSVDDPTKNRKVLDVEADRMVFWTRGDGKQAFQNMQSPGGETTQHIELYLSGNVEFRTENDTADKTKKEIQTLRCDELYYDVERNVAIALKADLEIQQGKLPDALHVRSAQILQLNSKIFTADQAILSASKLPSDPALTVYIKNVVVEERDVLQKTIWGTQKYNKDGTPKTEKLHDVTGNTLLTYIEGSRSSTSRISPAHSRIRSARCVRYRAATTTSSVPSSTSSSTSSNCSGSNGRPTPHGR